MIVNIENKKDLISLDFRMKEIRYVKNGNINSIKFIELNNDDIDGYEYLLKNPKRTLFYKVLKDELKDKLNINIVIKNLKEIKT